MTSQAVEIPGYIAGTWDLDPVHSTIGFVARHLMVSKVRGRFTSFEGQIVTAPNPLDSSATATVDLSSVDTGNETRDNDLRSENFFDASAHPKMTYQSTALRPNGDTFLLDGDLTIRGATRPVTLLVEINGFGPDPYGGTRAGFSATGAIDRTEFGITFNAPVPGTSGVMVSENIEIEIEIEAEAVLRQEQPQS